MNGTSWRKAAYALVVGLSALAVQAGDVTKDGVRTLTDGAVVTVTKEADLGDGVTQIVIDNATLNFNLAADATLTNTYTLKNGGKLGVGPAGRNASIDRNKFFKPSLGNTFGKTGAGTLWLIGGALGVVNEPTKFIVHEGTVHLNSGDFFGNHSGCTLNFAVDVREGATWHNGPTHGSIGPVELTGATWRSETDTPSGGFWSDTSFKGGIVVHKSAKGTPSKIHAQNWDFLGQPPNSDCVVNVEQDAELMIYTNLRDGSGVKCSLTKRGTGTLYLMGEGSWTGGTVLEAGKIVLGNAKALGTSAITLKGDVEIAVEPGVTVTCPELTGAGKVTVSGKGGISFPKKAASVEAVDKAAEPYNPVEGGKVTISSGVTDFNVPAGQTLTLNEVVESRPGCAEAGDIRKTGGGTLVFGGNLRNKYRKLIVAAGAVEFANNDGFGMSGIGNGGGVEVAGGTIRPVVNYSTSAVRFTFTGADGRLDVPEGVIFQTVSNCLYTADATVTKVGKGGWQLTSQFQTSQAKVAGTKWIIEEGRLFTTGGSTFGSHAVAWNGTIEVHENGEFAMDSANGHQPVGPVVLRGGTVRTPIAQFDSNKFNAEGAQQWTGFTFNGGIKAIKSDKPSRVISRSCHSSHESFVCNIDVEEGAVLEMNTMLRRGYSYSPSFHWVDGNIAKLGAGTLRLLKPVSVLGFFDILAGTVELAEGGYIDPNAKVRVLSDAKLLLNDGTRFVADVDMESHIVSKADVWIDATRVKAADGETLNTIRNLGLTGGEFAKFPKAVADGIIPNAPKYVAKGIGGMPSFGFDGSMALKLDSYKNTGYNCEVFVVGCWTNFTATGSQGQWGGLVSLGSVEMTDGEDQYNKGVLSCFFSGSGTTINNISVMFGNSVDGRSVDNRSSCAVKPGSLLKNQPFVFRMMRGKTAGNADLWRGDDNLQSASSGYKVQPANCRIDRVSLGSRLMTGGCATTYAATSTATRNLIGWIGEVLIFTEELSEDEKAAVNDYLRRKWIGTTAAKPASAVAGEVCEVKVEVAEGAKAACAIGLNGGADSKFAVTKTGTGELILGGGNVEKEVNVKVAEGSVRLQKEKLPSRAAIWIDADDAATCLTDASGHVTNLVNKGYCAGSFGQAPGVGKTPQYPVRTANGMNGRATLTFNGEAALMTECYTNHTSPRLFSVYAVQRRNSWRLMDPDDSSSNHGGYGKWATPYTFVPNKNGQDESIPGVFHVDDSPEATSYADIGNITTGAITAPGNGNPAIFFGHTTANGYCLGYEKADTAIDAIPRISGSGNVEAADIERVFLGGRSGNAKVHYYGSDNTANRCWYGDLAEMIVVTEPLSLQEEAELFGYLRKKWLNKGTGSATPPAWLSGASVEPEFGDGTTLTMADGTALVHAADELTLGALTTEGTVDWTRLWNGEKADFPMFAADELSLATVNFMPIPAVRKIDVKVLDYGTEAGAATWRVYRPDGKLRQAATISDRGGSLWLFDQMGSLLMLR